ncbi:MAG TPA: hypothetical protein VLT35_05115 [Methanocella sp.]|nr:hypothetical protein [Methanocella sp.]
MPECHQCKFFRPRNIDSGECTNFRIILQPHGNADLCPIRRFVPNPVYMYSGPDREGL